MMMASVSNTNKRKRDSDIRLTDITDALKINVASYLPQPSCISFALAVSNSHDTSYEEPSALCTSALCMAIASAAKETSIDLKDIQDILGRSLTDDDVRWVLIAIDANNKIKSLKLTNCLNVIGSGLEPLRGSIVLERIDLSLVGDHERPSINPEPPISVDAVVPILHSIIAEVGNELVRVQLPEKWRVERSSNLTSFLQRFDRELESRKIKCSGKLYSECEIPECEEICEGTNGEPLVSWDGGHERGYIYNIYGMSAFHCNECKQNFCRLCYISSSLDDNGTSFCNFCEKYYCSSCDESIRYRYCNDCGTSSCYVCDGVKCW